MRGFFRRNRRSDGPTWPSTLMDRIFWNVNDDPFPDEAAFVAALRAYYDALDKPFDVDPDLVVLPSERVIVQYSYVDDGVDEDEEIEDSVELTAADARGFRQAELLFATHNHVCEKMADTDHPFFEGYSLWTGDSGPTDVPRYFLVLGS